MKLVAPFVLLAIAILLLWLSRRQRAGLGVPRGRVIYADMGDAMRLEQPLYDAALNLVGRPDYLVSRGEELIPVEVKSGRTPAKPYESHIYQLAAYCVLVARQTGHRPSHGLIHYPERSFQVEFTPQLENELLNLLEDMHSARPEAQVLPRSHQQAARCRACGFLQVCDQSL